MCSSDLLESGFLALLLFGWNKVGPKMHFFSTCMVALGAHFSAIWIIVANSWMQTPAGFELIEINGKIKAQITNFWEVVFCPSMIDRLTHAIAGCWLAGAFLVLSVCAFYLLRGKFTDFATRGMKIGIVWGCIAVLFMGYTGDSSARHLVHTQPEKFATMEGVVETGTDLPLHIIGYMSPETHEFTGLSFDGMLSI